MLIGPETGHRALHLLNICGKPNPAHNHAIDKAKPPIDPMANINTRADSEKSMRRGCEKHNKYETLSIKITNANNVLLTMSRGLVGVADS